MRQTITVRPEQYQSMLDRSADEWTHGRTFGNGTLHIFRLPPLTPAPQCFLRFKDRTAELFPLPRADWRWRA